MENSKIDLNKLKNANRKRHKRFKFKQKSKLNNKSIHKNNIQ